MAEVSKETGVLVALARRMTDERLPKALALKERVGSGHICESQVPREKPLDRAETREPQHHGRCEHDQCCRDQTTARRLASSAGPHGRSVDGRPHSSMIDHPSDT